MGNRKGFIRFDMFKLAVLIILLILLVFLSARFSPGTPMTFLLEDKPKATDSDSFETENEQTVEALSVPDFPKSNRDLVLNGDRNGLVDADGNVLFTLSDGGKKWVPAVNDPLKLLLPNGFTTRQDESGIWHIIAADETVIYIFNEEESIWEMNEKTEPADLLSAVTGDQDFACPLANPVRIGGKGERLRVVNAVIPLRGTPDAVSQNFILELNQNTALEVIGGPICQPFLSGANVWWNVRLQNGAEGYAAEGSAISDTYYLEPVQ